MSAIIGRVKRGRRILVALLGFALVPAVLAAAWPREKEPEYQGKKLSEWLIAYQGYGRFNSEPTNALHHIGTNALPFLIKWLPYELPKWRNRLTLAVAELPNSFPRRFLATLVMGQGAIRASVTLAGFRYLGQEAAPAVPAITQLLGDWNSTQKTDRALMALMLVGKDGLPPLVTVFTNKAVPTRYRVSAGSCIADPLMNLGTNAGWVVQVLLPYLDDPEIAFSAANVLGHLNLAPEQVVPALTKGLRSPEASLRRESATALARFQALSAVPDLRAALSDNEQAVRDAATNALQQIAPEVLKKDEH